ncbi:SMC family ATPase [Paenibacillus roseipurpureus]|uniref:Nuclease SbcCD subunit C n=1 Tax=Paenibacillus roseopurpureus TaxID=2918901 RepID=A0AA96LXJ4_9BACL|nr:SMC family ATPase [Paenibacillus sp. MBLB1832]WNR46375.1 SMC family ATPase [Paenibacillus sp. MBLB1832]
MRPIQLQLSGLQSYRELQTIDFSQLVDAGVFGIFGPTGSGKSSLLDAITLSLYGKVERASGGTQAIMNHAESTLFVSFTFELTNAVGTERYRVERQFKRGTEMSINGTIARFLHIQGNETIVLADKAGEVNQQVQHILGLSMQDFTRAVVLPQGKFAEFLTLTGKDRRQMLQRLFHLEAYGDQLSIKVSSKVKETDSLVKQLGAEQQGLGEASSTALEEANRRLQESEEEAIRTRISLEQQETIYAQNKQVHEWLKESEALESQLIQHREQSGAIAEKERQLQDAERAERVLPFAQQYETASKEVVARKVHLEEATKAHVASETAFGQASEAFEKAQTDLTLQEGPLLLRLDQLEQALVIQKELEQVQLQMGTAQTQEIEVKLTLSKLQADLTKAVETKNKAITKQNELKAQLKLVHIETTARQLLQGAVHEKKTIVQLQAQEQDAQKNKDDKLQAKVTLEQALEVIANKKSALQLRLSNWLQTHATCSEIHKRVSSQLTEFLSQVQNWMEHQRRLWKQQERHALALRIAAELEVGEPCPVCGSLDHPGQQSASTRSNATQESHWEELLHQGEQLVQRVKEGQFQGIQLERRFSESLAFVLELADAREHKDKSIANSESSVDLAFLEAAAGQAAVMINTKSKAIEEKNMADLLKEWNLLETSLQSCTSQANDLENAFQNLNKAHRDLAQQELMIRTQMQAAIGVYEEAERRFVDVAAAIKNQFAEWHQRYPSFHWEEVDEQLQLLLEKEQQAEELRGRIEKSVPFLEELSANIERLQTATQEQDRTALQLHERLQGLAQLAADKSRQLAQRAPGAAVPQLIAEASSALAQLRQLAQQTKLAHAAAQREQSLAAQRYSAAAEAAAAAARQLEQTERALHSALAEHGFASREAVVAAALAPELRRQWAQLAAEHREREQALRAQLAQLAAKLQGRVLSAAEWAQSQAQLQAAKAAAEAVLEARAKAAQGASELAARHQRWCELEALRLEQAKQLERLGKLQSVLKANAFVEYLAEEQLMQVSRAASERLGELTRRRYGIEVDSGGGFVIRDDANGGVKRPVGTLSGGETFLTSLALALALSAQIQLKGEYPLEFFFLDEGFGTLDQELLDMVIGALEKLHMDRLAVGVISHVPELRARLVRKLIVHPAEPSGRGSRIILEGL